MWQTGNPRRSRGGRHPRSSRRPWQVGQIPVVNTPGSRDRVHRDLLHPVPEALTRCHPVPNLSTPFRECFRIAKIGSLPQGWIFPARVRKTSPSVGCHGGPLGAVRHATSVALVVGVGAAWSEAHSRLRGRAHRVRTSLGAPMTDPLGLSQQARPPGEVSTPRARSLGRRNEEGCRNRD